MGHDDYFHTGKALMRWSRLIVAVLLSVSVAVGANAQSSASAATSEYLIKAGFIYNFAQLVQWPSTAFSQADSPIVIGILGTDPFGTSIDRVVENKKLDGRNLIVKRLRWSKDLKDLTECNILFISSSEKEHIPDVINMLKWLPILTIGETPGFAARGGIINLTLEDNKVRFEVNIGAAKQANLNISSRLLALARIVPQGTAADGKKSQ
ncbi:MAG TPA: YfiR family protein [Candidatus Acidoferrum sp.]|nr:YfiR family protein [Candidatus Acidoferrum sp.]